MRILFDYEIFEGQSYGGISRYFYELISRSQSLEELNVLFPYLGFNNYFSPVINSNNFFLNNFFKKNKKLREIYNKNILLKHIRNSSYEVLHLTYYNYRFSNHNFNKPLVITIHDMIYEKFPQFFGNDSDVVRFKKALALKADKIIAVSENTKKDILEIYNINEKKIDVIHHGCSLLDNNDGTKRYNFNKRYVLYVGSRWGYKNFNNFLIAMAPLLLSDTSLLLYCIGGGKITKDESQLIESLGVKNKVFQFTVNDSSLIGFYRNALVFVFPSLYEGFGIPLLEAFSFGCPVACSNTSSFPEVAGKSAIYFNPNDKIDILGAVKLILENNKIRQELINNGHERLKQFSLKKMVDETSLVYKKLI